MPKKHVKPWCKLKKISYNIIIVKMNKFWNKNSKIKKIYFFFPLNNLFLIEEYTVLETSELTKWIVIN